MTDALDTVKRFVEARRTRDLQAALSLADETIEVVGPNGDAVSGINAVREGWQSEPDLDHLEVTVEPQQITRVRDDRVLVFVDQVFRWKETGEVANVVEAGAVYNVRDGRIGRVRVFTSRDQARATAEAE